MKVCFVGGCVGHAGSAFDTISRDIEYIGAAPGSEYETMDKLKAHAAAHGCEFPIYRDWREMLLELKPDIAVVDTVFSYHAEVSRFALAHHIHVYAEKPAATEPEALRALKLEAERSENVYFSMLTARYSPWFYTAKRLADSGEIGRIRMINAQKSYKLGQRPEYYRMRSLYGGTIPWVAIHMIDQILWITGKRCQRVAAQHSSVCNSGHGELEAVAEVMMRLEDDILASVHTDYYRPKSAPSHGDDRIRIVGTEGIIEVREDKVWLTSRQNDGSLPAETVMPDKIFDGFLKIIGGADDPIYKDCGGLYSTEIALFARSSADRGGENIILFR